MPTAARPLPRHRCFQAGFSLVEIWLTLLIMTSGILGMTALQGQAFQSMQEARMHSRAIHLANEMAETIRSHRQESPDGTYPAARSGYFKTDGSPAPSVGTSCTPVPSSADQRLACWFDELRQTLPVDDKLINRSMHICPSSAHNRCGSGPAIEIKIAWYPRGNRCPHQDGNGEPDVCHYFLRFTP